MVAEGKDTALPVNTVEPEEQSRATFIEVYIVCTLLDVILVKK